MLLLLFYLLCIYALTFVGYVALISGVVAALFTQTQAEQNSETRLVHMMMAS
jgi:hypothetical protein